MHPALRLDLARRLAALPALAGVDVAWQPSASDTQNTPRLALQVVAYKRGMNHAGDNGGRDARIQLTAQAADAGTALAIREAVLDNLHGFSGSLILDGSPIDSCQHVESSESFDRDAQQFRSTCDLIIQYQSNQ